MSHTIEPQKKPIWELKAELKGVAVEIRKLKHSRKQVNRGNKTLTDIQFCLWKQKYNYRHMHIAYCELRGVTRERIEKKVDPSNKANEIMIQTYKDMYYIPARKDVTTVCISQI